MSTALTADFSFTNSEDEEEELMSKMKIKKETSMPEGDEGNSTDEDSEIEEVNLATENEDEHEEPETGRSAQDQGRREAESSYRSTGADLVSGDSMEGIASGTVAGALTTEVSEGGRTRTSSIIGRSASSIATYPSSVILFQDDDDEQEYSESRSTTSNKRSRDQADTERDPDERSLTARSVSNAVSSQRSRTDGATSAATGEERITLSHLKNGELALVWFVGNEEFSTFSSQKVKKVRRATVEVDLIELCEAVERVYPKMMKAVRAKKTTRTNIRLTHIGMLLKGLMIIYRTQLQELKKTFVVEYEKLKNPVQIAIDLPTDLSAKNKKTKTRPEEDDRFAMDAADLTFGVFHAGPGGSDTEVRVAGGGEYLESTIDDGDDNTPSKNKKSKKQRKQKRVQEQDILKLLEHHADELQQNGAAHILPGAEIDLPEPPAEGDLTNLLDSCHMFDILDPEPDREEIERTGREAQKNAEKSPPSSQLNGKRNNTEAVPVAPRKRARTESTDSENNSSSFALSTLSYDTKISARRRRHLIFNRIDKNPTITLRTLVKGQKTANSEEKRRLLDERIAQTLSAMKLAGLNLIANSGRKIANVNLKALVKQSLPKPAELLRHDGTDVGRKKRKRAENVTDLEIEQERARAEEDHDLHEFVNGSPAATINAEIPENLPFGDISFLDAEIMEPMQAEPIINSEDTQEIMLKAQGEEQEPNRQRLNTRPKKTFTQIVGVNANKIKAAHVFVVLLKMQAQRKIQLIQGEPYGELSIQQLEKQKR